MADEQPIQEEPIPQTLSHLIALNEHYGMLLCVHAKCPCAVRPAAVFDYLRRQYQVRVELRKQVDRHIEGFPHQYDYSAVGLPVDGLAPQPVIEAVNGLECDHCPLQSSGPFRTQSRKASKQHGNEIQQKKRVADEDLFHPVRLQSWWEGAVLGCG